MKVENITYIEAIKLLAKKYHIEVEEKEMTPEQKIAANERESLMTVNEWLNLHFIHNLTETAEGRTSGYPTSCRNESSGKISSRNSSWACH